MKRIDTRARKDLLKEIEDLTADVMSASGRLISAQQRTEVAEMKQREAVEAITEARKHAARLGGELAEIKGSLNQVAVYEGLLDVSPTAMLVSELVRDHEELESRIDAAVLVCREAITYSDGPEAHSLAEEIARLLQGGARVPNDVGDLADGMGDLD